MKKLFIAIMAVAVAIVSCDKTGDPMNVLEGQWITEEFEPEGDFPAGRYVFDFGAKSGAGKFTNVFLVTESNSEFTEGDMVLLSDGSYTYDVSTGKVVVDGDEAVVEFLTKTKIKLTVDGQSLFFTLVQGKQYPVKDAIPFESELAEFEVTPSKEADWAGGSVTFIANREIKSMTYDAVTEGVIVDPANPTKLENNTLTLGLYKDADGKMADCDIQIKVADIDGNETTVIVASEAWRPAVYTKYNGEYTEDDLSQGWTRGAECWLGAVSTMDEITYDGTSDTFEGISYQVPDFMTPVGNDIDKVCYDTPSTNRIGTITFTYGELTYELEIDISR